MSGPFEQYDPGQQSADPNAPTQFTPIGGPQPQPGYGQQAPGAAPVWGQGAPAQPTMPYPYAGTPIPQSKPGRSGFAGFFLRSPVGRLAIILIIAGGVAVYHFATSHPAQRNGSGQVSQSGSLQASALKVGDCFDNPAADSNISSITAIPCTQAHDSQVFAEPAITESAYPGEATLAAEAKNDCDSQSTQSSISQDAPGDLEISALYPQDAQTFANGTDFITCIIISGSKNLTTSYVSGS
jgi:hypothetical protein